MRMRAAMAWQQRGEELGGPARGILDAAAKDGGQGGLGVASEPAAKVTLILRLYIFPRPYWHCQVDNTV